MESSAYSLIRLNTTAYPQVHLIQSSILGQPTSENEQVYNASSHAAGPGSGLKHPKRGSCLQVANTERFHNRDNRIFATGRCSSDAEFLAKGRYFVNPQESGSGIKIKSLVAMASGKLLISTPIGVEGIPTKNGAHCLISSSIDQMHEPLILCLSEPDRFARLGAQAKRLVSPRFSRSTFLDETLPQIREHLTQG